MTPERFVHYTTGIKEIDDEHFAMLHGMDAVVKTCKEQHHPDPIIITSQLRELEKVLLDHLDHEEKIMNDGHYQWADSHKLIHDQIRARMAVLLRTVDGSFHNTEFIVRELEAIFVSHIDNYDMQIKLHLTE